MRTDPPNILWVTLDSVRADHTSLHGYRRDTTPELAHLAATDDGLSFSRCFAHSTRTPVSVPSMLTGTYPSHHQVGIGEGPCGNIPESMTTVPEMLAERGYHTTCISQNLYAGEATGLDKRFHEYINPSFSYDLQTYPHILSLLKYCLQAWKHSGGLSADKQRHPTSYIINDVAKRKLKSLELHPNPFFLYIHDNTPHRPYLPPRSFVDQYLDHVQIDAGEALAFAKDMHENTYEYIANGLPFSDDEWEMLLAMYDSVLAYTDACLGSLLDYVQSNLENTVIVVTSDHGELFGEHGLLGHHIVLNDAVTHVPLVVYGLPELVDQTEEIVQHIDIMQTLVELAGADTTQFRGVDLRSDQRSYAISQDLRGTVENEDTQDYQRILKHNSNFDTSKYHQSMLTALRTKEFKLLHTDENTSLHRLPDETEDVSAENPEKQTELEHTANEWLKTEGRPFLDTPEQKEHSDEVQQHLREMGYID